MTALLAVIGAILGLALGSFVNVVAHRVPAGRSVVRPPSACPRCEHPIAPRDNIPILSWFLLGRRCRNCEEPISARYPLVEAGTALLFVAAAIVVGPKWVLAAYWWFAAVTMALILTDLDHKLIPNRILFPGTAVGAALLLVGSLLDGDLSMLGWSVVTAVGYFAGLLVIALVARGGFGYGDVKLAFLLGMFAGYLRPGYALLAAFAAFFAGGVVSILLLAFRIRGRKDAIPFGPYLILGAYVAVAFGDPILEWYLG